MDCLRSFSFRVDTNTTLSGANVKNWTTSAGNHYWSAFTTGTSRFNIQGFKNVNIYGIDVIGTVLTLTNAPTAGVIVEDWGLTVLINGQAPLISDNVTSSPNFYGISAVSPANNNYTLSKFNSKLSLASPIESVSYLELGSTVANGYGYQTLGDVNLVWNLNFVVFYKYEGE